jgi:hypothetical protein
MEFTTGTLIHTGIPGWIRHNLHLTQLALRFEDGGFFTHRRRKGRKGEDRKRI